MTSDRFRICEFAFGPLLLLAFGCGGRVEGSSNDSGKDFPVGPETPGIGTATSALVAGALNASQGLIADSSSESETAAVTLDFPPGTTYGTAVAFNATDITHTSGSGATERKCRGWSASAVSYLTANPNNAFRAFRVPVSISGISALRGDPAMVAQTGNGAWIVWVSSLAYSDSRWNSAADGNGCVLKSDLNDVTKPVHNTDRACVHPVFIPADGSPGFALPGYGWCVASSGGNMDGGSLFASPSTGKVYAAYWNVARDRVDVYQNGVAIASPFTPGVKVYGHPIFTKSKGTVTFDGYPTVIVPDSNGTFYLSRLNEQTMTWTQHELVADGYRWGQNVAINGGPQVRPINYTADSFSNNAEDYLWFVYSKPADSSGKIRLQAVRCSFIGTQTLSCTKPAAGITPAGANAFMPTLASVGVNGDYRPWVSYWSDVFGAGNLILVMARISRGAPYDSAPLGTMTPYYPGPIEQACPYGDYWGDYDSMTVWNNGSAQPTLLRYLTDSTAGPCVNGDPQHVSVALGNGAL